MILQHLKRILRLLKGRFNLRCFSWSQARFEMKSVSLAEKYNKLEVTTHYGWSVLRNVTQRLLKVTRGESNFSRAEAAAEIQAKRFIVKIYFIQTPTRHS